ncbi:MAG TPA: hypothetical protein PKL04_05995 [Methanofastidiosum sp.]|nr:hypothetical protein [Methanofastidiosum sp.]
MKIKWAYILIGDNNTGKTLFQKEIIYLLTSYQYERLECNIDFIVSINSLRSKTLFVMSRSFQEKHSEYITVSNYFENYFKPCDICILSSHLIRTDIESFIIECKKRYYNICGVFWENSISKNESDNSLISSLDWNKRIIIENNITENRDTYISNIKKSSVEFCNYILTQ